MKKVVALSVSLMLLFAFTIGCKPAETPKPETPAEVPAPGTPDEVPAPGTSAKTPAPAPAPGTPAGPPDVVVVPSGTSYVYMVPDVRGLYFYYGYWYLFYEGYWYRSAMYSGPWIYIQTAIVPLVVVNIPLDYIYYIPSGYHRIHYRDLFRNWLTWDHSRYWNKYDWYKNEWQRYTNRYKPRGGSYKPQGMQKSQGMQKPRGIQKPRQQQGQNPQQREQR